MSNADLLRAQLHRRNRIMGAVMLAGVAVIAIGLGVVLFSTNPAPPDPALGEPVGQHTTSQPQPAPAPIPPSQQPSSVPNPALSAALPAIPADGSVPEDQQKFLRAVQRFAEDTKAKVDAFPDLLASARYDDLIAETEAQLVTLSGQARYQDALAHLATATATIEAWMLADLDRFQNLLGEAERAWRDKRLTALDGIIATAKTLYTDQPQPLDHYRALRGDWPVVKSALQRADKARAENNPAAEQTALQDIRPMTHDIAGLDKRIAAVSVRLHRQRVDQLLNHIATQLAARDAAAAQTALKELVTLDPKTLEIPKLRADLVALEEGIAFDAVMQKMDQLAAADNWSAAQQLAAASRQKFGSYERFQQRADFIDKVHGLITASTALLDAPDQLISISAQHRADTIRTTSQTAQSFSPTLAGLVSALDTVLASYKTPLEIIVLSDSQTFVEVKSVGQVGAVDQKTIQLLPGDYIFEGKRKGYVTARVPVKLRPGDSGIKISVIADEQI